MRHCRFLLIATFAAFASALSFISAMAQTSDSLYIHTVFDFLQEHLDARGVIVDLRNNTGGNMYPMIASVSPLLPDGVVLRFKSRKQTTPIFLEYVTKSYQVAAQSIGKLTHCVRISQS